jgi:hypothetical protein
MNSVATVSIKHPALSKSKSKKGCSLSRKGCKGSALLEVLFGLLIFLPVTLCGLDLIVLVSAYFFNIEICQQSARAASLGVPSVLDSGAPKARAMVVLGKFLPPGGLFVVQPNVEVTEVTDASRELEVFGGAVSGKVTVKITSEIAPPFCLKSILQRKTIELVACESYPFTWTVRRKSKVAD